MRFILIVKYVYLWASLATWFMNLPPHLSRFPVFSANVPGIFLSVILHYRWSHVATFGFTLVTKAVSYDQCAQALTDWSFTSCVVLINSTKPTFLEFIFLCNSFLIQIKLSLWFIIVLIFFSIFWILFFL